MTPLEIQIASYTIGVRFGLIPIKMGDKVKVNNYGGIIPESGFIMGPNTSEMLLMGISDPMNGQGGSYYGLHSRLNVNDNPELENNADAFAAALDVVGYWTSIDVNYVKE